MNIYEQCIPPQNTRDAIKKIKDRAASRKKVPAADETGKVHDKSENAIDAAEILRRRRQQVAVPTPQRRPPERPDEPAWAAVARHLRRAMGNGWTGHLPLVKRSWNCAGTWAGG